MNLFWDPSTCSPLVSSLLWGCTCQSCLWEFLPVHTSPAPCLLLLLKLVSIQTFAFVTWLDLILDVPQSDQHSWSSRGQQGNRGKSASTGVINDVFSLILIKWHSEHLVKSGECTEMYPWLSRYWINQRHSVLGWGPSSPALKVLSSLRTVHSCHIKALTPCLKQVLHLVFWVLNSLSNPALVAYYWCPQISHNKWQRRKLSPMTKLWVILGSPVAPGLAAFRDWCWSRTWETIAYFQ